MSEPLDRDPVVLIYDVARIMRTKFDQRARAREMTRAQWHILARVDRQPGLSQSELASICEVEPITVARLVDRLEQRGLLERRPDPNDRRIWRLHTLPSARPVLEEISAYRREIIRDIDSHIGLDAREAMVNALLAIRGRMAGGPATPVDARQVGRRKRNSAGEAPASDTDPTGADAHTDDAPLPTTRAAARAKAARS